MPTINRRTLLSAGLSAGAVAMLGGRALAYPTRNIRVVVPYSAGGTTDFVARILAEKMSEIGGQRVFVENKTGAAGAVGLKDVAGAAPDGHAMVMSDTVLSIAPTLNPAAGLTPTLFEPVTLVATFPSVLVVHPAVPASTVGELIEHARKNPGKVNFGSGGVGTGPHLQGEFFKSAAKIDIQHVAYRGAAAALQDVVGGSIQMLFTGAPTAMSFVQGGKLKLLATTGAERLPAANSVPTLDEAGLKGCITEQWFGLLAPAKTPADIVAKANEIAVKALTDRGVSQRISEQGGFPKPGTPQDFARFIARDTKLWGDIIRTANVTAPQ